MSPSPMRWLFVSSSFALGLIAGACTLPNPNHCFNLAVDPNAWCATLDEARPYCSPCAAANYGCVADEPTSEDCPWYTTPDPETGTGESGTETGTGGETGTETGGATETGGETGAGTETSG